METIKIIPLDRLIIETDSPYCGIKSDHAGYNLLKTRFK